ncbi:hypothetical protein CsatB_018468 [Cannabis sativa]
MAEMGVEENRVGLNKKRLKTKSNMVDEEDRISELPDEIIIHILSFLPTEDVVRTCFLSKRWKLMWYLVPKLSFYEQGHRNFDNYVNNCLKHRKRGMVCDLNSVITSFKVTTNNYRNDTSLDKWLDFAVENKVKEINLSFSGDWSSSSYYWLPETLVVKAIYLTILDLALVRLDSRYSFSFPSLKSLSLSSVWFADTDTVDKLLLGSPSLENLQLDFDVFSFRDCLHLCSVSLKFLDINTPNNIGVEIECINLESLTLQGFIFDKINLSSCSKAIRNISLTCFWGAVSSSLEHLISSLPLLENLTLSNWHPWKLKHIKISSQTLKSFNLNHSDSEEELTVLIESAPKLTSFCYNGNFKLSVSMVESCNLLNGTFILANNYDINWFVSMVNFLLNLNCSWKRVSLHVDSDKALILPKDLKRLHCPPLINCEHLRVFTKCKLARESDLRDVLLSVCPSLKTLSIAEGARKGHL